MRLNLREKKIYIDRQILSGQFMIIGSETVVIVQKVSIYLT